MSNRYFAIGDLHGCLDVAEKAVGRIRTLEPEGCKIIFLGDYIDRGPDSLGCLEFVRTLKEQDNGYEVVTLMGNHELMYVDAHFGKHAYYDQKAMLEIFHDDQEFWVGWMSRLDGYHIEGKNVFAHADFDEDNPGAINTQVWPRYRTGYPYHGEYHLTHGHTPHLRGPETAVNRTNLDTGAVFDGGKLTVGEYHYGKRGPQKFYQFEKNSVDKYRI